MWVCRFGSNVSGLCKFELGCNGQDPQGSEFKPPSVLWVYVIFFFFFAFETCVVSYFSYRHFILCFSMLHYDNFNQNIDLKVTFLFQP
jgi:hypothetical protein